MSHPHRKTGHDITESSARRHSDNDTMMQHLHYAEKKESAAAESDSVNEDFPQIFCQLDILRRSEESDYAYWKEKARWIRFEEIAENVLGRWSKPHVATLMQTSLLDLKIMLRNGVILLNVSLNDLATISQTIAQELLDARYFHDAAHAQKLSLILNLPHFHHHDKRLAARNASAVSLAKQGLHPSSSFIANNINSRDEERDKPEFGLNSKPAASPSVMLSGEHEDTHGSGQTLSKRWLKFNKNPLKSSIKNHTDRDENDYNVKLQRKVDSKSEGASILICPVDFVETQTIVFVRLQKPTDLPGLLEIKISSRFIILLIGPEEHERRLLQMGRTMATILTDDICREYAHTAKNSDDILKMMDRFMQDTYVIPPSEWDPSIRIEPPPKCTSKEQRQAQSPEEKAGAIADIDLTPHVDPNLVASKRPFHGLMMDIRNKLPYYVSDFSDSATLQCLAATLYLYLVCLCSLVAFGGMLGTATENYMATMESILAASISGILYALFSGQPLNIISATGPMLILERIIEHLCRDYHINYLEFRLWIGVWVFIFLMIFVIFNLSFLVKFITRFTEDCFASLVALIFIYDAIRGVLKIRQLYPVNYRPDALLDYSCSCLFTDIGYNDTTINDTNIVDYLFHGTNLNKTSQVACVNAGGFVVGSGCSTPVYHADIFFFSVLLFLCTFLICMMLKQFRNSPFLPTKVRTILSDFSVLIAIVIMSGWDAYLLLNTPKLQVPTEFKPTRPHDRGWLIPFFDKNPLWTIPLAIVPAIIATILIFMDQQITAVIINRKEFKLKKNLGYHLDLFILSFCILIQSILGLPWFVAATVLALTHVNALKLTSENSAPGEKPKFEGILEQRVSALLVSILTGICVLFTPILGHIPMPVLYGVFLFMGVSALRNMQVYDRFMLFFMPQKYQPDYPYLRHVRISRVHMFTIIQILSIFGMFGIKKIKLLAITFPLLVVGTCFIRKLMDRIFSQEELYWLDDILPGTKAGLLRQTSALRSNQVSKISHDLKNDERKPFANTLLTSKKNESKDALDKSLSHIAEEEAQQLMQHELSFDKHRDTINKNTQSSV